MLSSLLRRLSVVGCAGVLVVSLTAMFVPGAYAAQPASVTRAVPAETRALAGRAGLDFDALTQRVHPAESRVRMLAENGRGHHLGDRRANVSGRRHLPVHAHLSNGDGRQRPYGGGRR